MKIEICAFSIESCINAQKGGANRVELCGGLYEGGTTPSYGVIKKARAVLDIDLYIMIRPRGGDFCYEQTELETMYYDIEMAKQLGANGIVVGCLLPNGEIDIETTRRMVELSYPMGVTFHRAFDLALEPFIALEKIIEAGCERILTSGQKATAFEGRDLLAKLVQYANNKIEIMAGAGVNASNAAQLAHTGVDALHLTAKAIRPGKMSYKTIGIDMASVMAVPEGGIVYSNIEQIEAIKKVLEIHY